VQAIKYLAQNATKTPNAVKQNNLTKTLVDVNHTVKKPIDNTLGITVPQAKANIKTALNNTCLPLSFNTHKTKRNVECVRKLQLQLRKHKLYLNCRIDGWFYTCTRDNVIKFKKRHNIKPFNSTVDKKVWTALFTTK